MQVLTTRTVKTVSIRRRRGWLFSVGPGIQDNPHFSRGETASSGATTTITLPYNTTTTDVLILQFSETNLTGNVPNAITAPAGWTAIAPRQAVNGTTGQVVTHSFWALGSVANLAFTNTKTGHPQAWLCMGFTGVDNLHPIDSIPVGDHTEDINAVITSAYTVSTQGAWRLILLGEYLLKVPATATSFREHDNTPAFAAVEILFDPRPRIPGPSTPVIVSNSDGSTTDEVLVALSFALRPIRSEDVSPPWRHQVRGGGDLFTDFQVGRWQPIYPMGGYGGDHIAWLKREHGNAGEVVGDARAIFWKPILVSHVQPSDHIEWMKREHGQAGEVVGDAASIHWSPLMTTGGYGGDHIAWLKPERGKAGEVVGDARSISWSPILVAHTQVAPTSPIPWAPRAAKPPPDVPVEVFNPPVPIWIFSVPPLPVGVRLAQYVPRVPDINSAHGRDRFHRFTEQVAMITNSLIRQGQLQQTGQTDYTLGYLPEQQVNWAGVPPADIWEALDRIAAALKALGQTP